MQENNNNEPEKKELPQKEGRILRPTEGPEGGPPEPLLEPGPTPAPSEPAERPQESGNE